VNIYLPDGYNPNDTILTSALPEAFGFLNRNPATLSLNGSRLSFPDDQAFSVFGGNIEFSNTDIRVRSGQINLLGVGSQGEIKIDDSDSESIKFDVDSFTDFGDITIT